MSGAVILMMSGRGPISNELDPYMTGGITIFVLALTILCIVGAFNKNLKPHSRRNCMLFASALVLTFLACSVAFVFSLH